jgi:hypothetical protein
VLVGALLVEQAPLERLELTRELGARESPKVA